jgi:hypothetical protein
VVYRGADTTSRPGRSGKQATRRRAGLYALRVRRRRLATLLEVFGPRQAVVPAIVEGLPTHDPVLAAWPCSVRVTYTPRSETAHRP